MPEIKNTHVKRIFDSIKKHTDEETAVQICGDGIKLSNSATDKKKMEWARNTMELLDKYDTQTVAKIRMDCACGPSKGNLNDMKDYFGQADSLKEFADLCNSKGKGFTIWTEGDDLYLSCPECYCSFVKKSQELLPKSWCLCSCGYTKRMFDYALGYEVDVELIESVKIGNARCVMKIVKKP